MRNPHFGALSHITTAFRWSIPSSVIEQTALIRASREIAAERSMAQNSYTAHEQHQLFCRHATGVYGSRVYGRVAYNENRKKKARRSNSFQANSRFTVVNSRRRSPRPPKSTAFIKRMKDILLSYCGDRPFLHWRAKHFCINCINITERTLSVFVHVCRAQMSIFVVDTIVRRSRCFKCRIPVLTCFFGRISIRYL